ncbi:MAG: hypothetical protein ACYS8W_08800 [Planctomycetota bacterium]|jgi:hypothetical protein
MTGNTRHAIITGLILATAFVSGCGSILGMEYSEQRFGPEKYIPDTAGEAIAMLGKPDVSHAFNRFRILGWKSKGAYGVISRIWYVPVSWAVMGNWSIAILTDENGRVLARGKIRSGRGYTILGGGTAPVIVLDR